MELNLLKVIFSEVICHNISKVYILAIYNFCYVTIIGMNVVIYLNLCE